MYLRIQAVSKGRLKELLKHPNSLDAGLKAKHWGRNEFEKGQAAFRRELKRHGEARQREEAGLEVRLGARVDQIQNLLGYTREGLQTDLGEVKRGLQEVQTTQETLRRWINNQDD